MTTLAQMEQTPPPPARRIWFAVLGPPLAWGLQVGLGPVFSGIACRGASSTSLLPYAAARALTVGLGVLALLVSIAATVVGLRAFRRSGEDTLLAVRGETRPDYLATIGFFMGAIFTLAALHGLVAAIFLPICETWR